MSEIEYTKTLSAQIEAGSLEAVLQSLENGSSPNEPQYMNNGVEVSQSTVLHQAVQLGHTEITEALIKAGADVNHQNFDQETPLFHAVTSGNQELITQLLAHGADVNHLNHEGFSPLLVACFNVDLPVVELLLARNADVTPLPDFPGQVMVVPLGSIGPDTQEDALPVLDALHKAGADVDGIANTRWTPLLYAVVAGLDIVAKHLLVNCKADPNAFRDGALPMYGAAGQKDPTFLMLLLEHGGDVHAGEGFYRPILAASVTGSVETVKTLLEAGADINTLAPNGQTPLMFSLKNDFAVTEYLVEAGADTSIKDSDGKTVLDWATEIEYDEVVSLLTEK